MKFIIYFLIFLSVLFSACEKQKNEHPYGTLIEVPDEVNSIQEAINISQRNDTILLHPGTFNEWQIQIDKPVFITSLFLTTNDSDYIDNTVIDANQNGRIFYINNISDTIRMNGFTIQNGYATRRQIDYFSNQLNYVPGLNYGGGIFCENSNLILENMVITENLASYPSFWGTGGGMYVKNSYLELNNIKLFNNKALGSSGGMYCDSSNLKIRNSFFAENTTTVGGSVIIIDYSDIEIENTLFKNNHTSPDYIPALLFGGNNGLLKSVSVINDTLEIVYSGINNVDVINCQIPGLKITER